MATSKLRGTWNATEGYQVNGTTLANASNHLTPTSVAVDSGTKTATATAGAATLNKNSGKITSEALTTAAAAEYTLTLTNSAIAAADHVFASVAYGTATAGTPVITRIKPAAGSCTILVKNDHATAAFDGTIVISFLVVKA